MCQFEPTILQVKVKLFQKSTQQVGLSYSQFCYFLFYWFSVLFITLGLIPAFNKPIALFFFFFFIKFMALFINFVRELEQISTNRMR